MYGLPQTGLLAQQLLEKRLEKHGYTQSKQTPGLWKHESRPICFSLVVDNSGMKYVGEAHANHLIQALKKTYSISEDWKGHKYCGLSLDWDYKKREVHPVSSMKGQRSHKTSHTNTRFWHTVQRCNMQRKRMIPTSWTRMENNMSNRWLGHFCSMEGQ